MTHKWKLVTILSLIVTLSALLAACGGPAATTEPQIVQQTVEVPVEVVETVVVESTVEVEVEREVVVTATPGPSELVELTYFTFSAAPDHLEDLDQMIAAFNAEYPNVQINVETAPFNDYFTKLQTLIAGGTAPDVFELNYENFVTYADKGVLLDLSPLMVADESLDSAIYYPRALEAFNYNGMQQGLPASFSTVVMFYNKELFDAAGVDYPTSDWTWDDARAAAEQINDPANDVYGLFTAVHFWEFYKKAAQNNCQFFNEDKTEVLINSPECVEALQTMVDFVEVDGVMPSAAEMGGVSDGDMFLQGKLGMLVSGIWMFSAFQDAPFDWDIVVEPGMDTQATHFFSNDASVFAATRHPVEAYQWAKFLTSNPEVAGIRVASNWELPALNNPEFFADYLGQTPPDNRQAVFDSLEYAIVPPVIARQNEMQDTVNQLIEQVALGQLTAQEALDQAKVAIEALLQ
jgi:multiple sugar transport system substrate-binding protein